MQMFTMWADQTHLIKDATHPVEEDLEEVTLKEWEL